MSLPKSLFIFALFLFGLIGCMAVWKGKFRSRESTHPTEYSAQQLSMSTSGKTAPPVHILLQELSSTQEVATTSPTVHTQTASISPSTPSQPLTLTPPVAALSASQAVPERPVPEVDNMYRFFMLDSKQFPIVETISYKSSVPWVAGRPAWVADYASHYHTSRHFIARSLNGKPDYNKQNVVEGDRFNILKPTKNLAFYLVVDLFRCKLWFYYVDLDAKEKVLVKSYSVGLGRWDATTGSGLLTPLGSYKLGGRTAVYNPKSKGIYNGQEIAMIGVFGTRWIPFEQEVAGCTAPAKGLGIHGCPWVMHPTTGQWMEDTSGINHHTSDGCIRLKTADVEELFSVIVSRPTTVILVGDFYDADVPGIEAPFTLTGASFGQEQEVKRGATGS